MAYCQKCGTLLDDGASFCTNCGSAVASNNGSSTGSITFIRKPCSVAKLVKTRVVVDGIQYGELKENEQLTVNLPYGVHTVNLKAAMNPEFTTQVQVASSNSVFFSFKLSMGGKPVRVDEPVNSVAAGTQNSGKKKGVGGKVILVILLFLAFFAMFRSIGRLASSSGSNDASKTSSTQTTATSATPEPVFQTYTGNVSNWEVTVNDFYYTKSVDAGLLSAYTAEDGSKFCIINITVKNTGTKAETFLPYVSWEGDPVAKIHWNQYEYIRSDLALSNDNLSSETLNPLVSTTGDIAFKLPDEVIDSGVPPVLVITANGQTFSCELIKK